MAVKEWTSQDVDALINKARGGDSTALYELQNASRLISKRANERMRELERKGLVKVSDGVTHGTSAYDRAKYYLQESLGLRNFSEGKHRSIDQIEDQIYEALAFNNSLTSTAAGVKLLQGGADKNIEIAENKYLDKTISMFNLKETYSDRRLLMELFTSDVWSELRERSGSQVQIQEYLDSRKRGMKMSDLKKIFKDYSRSNTEGRLRNWQGWMQGQKRWKN